jgi:hypothetical protein
VLQRLGLPPHRPLETDLQLTIGSQSYGGTPRKPAGQNGQAVASSSQGDDRPNLARMSPEDRLAYHRERIRRMLGG